MSSIVRESPELYMKVIENFSWLILGNIIYGICQAGIAVSITKFGSAEIFGQYSLGLAITSPIIIFFRFNMRNILATDAKSEYLFSDYLFVRLILSIAAYLFILMLVFAAGYQTDIMLIITGIGAFKLFESISDIIYGYFQKYEDMSIIGKSTIAKGLLMFLVIFISLLTARNVTAGVWLVGLSWLLLLIGYDFRKVSLKTSIFIHQNYSIVWKMIKAYFPMGFVMALVSIHTNIPIYFIKYFWGSEKLGYFSAISYFIPLGGLIVMAMSQSIAPRLSRYYLKGLMKPFRIIVYRLIALTLVAGLVLILFTFFYGEQFITFLYTKDYAVVNDIFPWIVGAAAVTYCGTYMGVILTIRRKFRELLYIHSFSALFILTLSWTLIPAYGLLGAAWAILGSEIVKVGICIQLNKKELCAKCL